MKIELKTSLPLALAALLAACAATGAPPVEEGPSVAEQLARMKSLTGDWYRTDGEAGDGPVMQYSLAANGSAVVERLFPGMEKEMVTMYFVDDGRLTLTHYCALGNQPTMIARASERDRIDFEFAGVSNLASRDAAHMHEHEIEFLGDDRVDATWILWKDNQEAERRLFPVERR
jgi:hypothetical protein